MGKQKRKTRTYSNLLLPLLRLIPLPSKNAAGCQRLKTPNFFGLLKLREMLYKTPATRGCIRAAERTDPTRSASRLRPSSMRLSP